MPPPADPSSIVEEGRRRLRRGREEKAVTLREIGSSDPKITNTLSCEARSYEVHEYLDPDGSNPFRAWFLGLGTRAREAVDDVVARMCLGNLGDHKRLGGGLIERRIHSGPGYRIYLDRDG